MIEEFYIGSYTCMSDPSLKLEITDKVIIEMSDDTEPFRLTDPFMPFGEKFRPGIECDCSNGYRIKFTDIGLRLERKNYEVLEFSKDN